MNYRDLVDQLSVPGPEVRSNFHKLSGQEVDFVHAAIGISTEAGELLDVAKKMIAYGQWLDSHRENVIEELGDLMFYMELAMSALMVSEETVKEKNKAKLMKRYSSGSFSKTDAAQRADKHLSQDSSVENLDGSYEI